MSGVCASRLLPNSFLMRALAGLAAGVRCLGLTGFGAVPVGGKGGRLVVLALGEDRGELVNALCRQLPSCLGSRYT